MPVIEHPTPAQVDAAILAWDAYVTECDARRAAESRVIYGHPGASLPRFAPDRHEAMRLALRAALALTPHNGDYG